MWTLTSDMDVASVHLMVSDGTDSHAVLDRARVILRDNHGIGHATLEPECHDCDAPTHVVMGESVAGEPVAADPP